MLKIDDFKILVIAMLLKYRFPDGNDSQPQTRCCQPGGTQQSPMANVERVYGEIVIPGMLSHFKEHGTVLGLD